MDRENSIPVCCSISSYDLACSHVDKQSDCLGPIGWESEEIESSSKHER